MEYRPSSKRSWYLVCCKPRQERLAQENLERQGFETYLPLMRQTRRRAHRRVTVIEPLFPRYLFIHLITTKKDNWSLLRSTIGVISLVRFGAQPAQVPDDLINELQAHESPQGLHDHSNRDSRRGEEERIGIKMEPLAEYNVIWLARNGKERTQVLLEIIGKQINTGVDENWIKHSET